MESNPGTRFRGPVNRLWPHLIIGIGPHSGYVDVAAAAGAAGFDRSVARKRIPHFAKLHSELAPRRAGRRAQQSHQRMCRRRDHRPAVLNAGNYPERQFRRGRLHGVVVPHCDAHARFVFVEFRRPGERHVLAEIPDHVESAAVDAHAVLGDISDFGRILQPRHQGDDCSDRLRRWEVRQKSNGQRFGVRGETSQPESEGMKE